MNPEEKKLNREKRQKIKEIHLQRQIRQKQIIELKRKQEEEKKNKEAQMTAIIKEKDRKIQERLKAIKARGNAKRLIRARKSKEELEQELLRKSELRKEQIIKSKRAAQISAKYSDIKEFRIFYLCTFGGCGENVLKEYLKTFGLVQIIYTRKPPGQLTYFDDRTNQFDRNKIPDRYLKNYTVLFLYRNPISSMRSIYFDSKHLKSIETQFNLTTKDLIKTGKDLFRLEKFFNNYIVRPKKPRNYKIIAVNFEKFLKNPETVNQEMTEFNKFINISNEPCLYPEVSEKTLKFPRKLDNQNLVENVYGKFNNRINKMPMFQEI